MQRYDVVVVGGRVAGAATALLLARRGLQVLVLERGRPGADTLSTHALMRGGAALLQRWGLLDRLAAAGTPPVRQTMFHYPGQTSTVSIKAAAGVDALYAPRRTVLDPLLVDAATAAGAEFRFGVTVTGLLRAGDGRVTGVVGRDRRGTPLAVPAWLTVGADGARSVVARSAGARTERQGTATSAIVYGYWPGLPATGYEWFYRPGGAAGFIPTNAGQTCVFAGIAADRFEAELGADRPAGYLRLLKDITGADPRLAAAEPPRRLHAFAGRPGFVRQAFGPGWALVGDAGFFEDPLSTHGLTDALRDAQLVAQAVAAVQQGEPDTAALSRFQARRDAAIDPIFEVVEQLCAYRWDIDQVQCLLRRLSSAMSDELEAVLRVDR